MQSTSQAFCKSAIVAALLLGNLSRTNAQLSDRLKEGIKIYTDSKDSSHFLKLNMTNQLWVRYNENNPETTVQGTREVSTSDMSIRRIRFVVSGQLTDRVAVFIQFGQNNLNYLSSRKTGSFFHDVTADYAVVKKKLVIGAGLNGWNGPSRFSNASVSSLLTLDPPIYQEVTNDTYDQFVRRLGVYAKGKLGKLDYRLSAGKPFVIQTATNIDPLTTQSTFSTLPPKWVTQGYFMYQLLEPENNLAPSTCGTYHGNKRIFNVGAGFYHQKDAMFRKSGAGDADTTHEDIQLWSVDMFYDTPVNAERGTAFSFYSCYSQYDYGFQYLKVAGANNLANGTSKKNPSLFEKANYGNAMPYLGTGQVLYVQTGYKFGKNLLGNSGTLQPYIDGQYATYARLSAPMFVYDIGLNWLIRGHQSKITLNYQNRPYFGLEAGELTPFERKSQWVLQYQVAF